MKRNSLMINGLLCHHLGSLFLHRRRGGRGRGRPHKLALVQDTCASAYNIVEVDIEVALAAKRLRDETYQANGSGKATKRASPSLGTRCCCCTAGWPALTVSTGSRSRQCTLLLAHTRRSRQVWSSRCFRLLPPQDLQRLTPASSNRPSPVTEPMRRIESISNGKLLHLRNEGRSALARDQGGGDNDVNLFRLLCK